MLKYYFVHVCSDLDSYDLIVAMDIEVRDEVLLVAGSKSSGDTSEYSNKVLFLTI